MDHKIKKGSIYAYRQYNISNEIDLKKVHTILEKTESKVRVYQIKSDPLRSVSFKEPPLIFSNIEEDIKLEIKDKEILFKTTSEIKCWDYGILSFAYRLEIPENLTFEELTIIGSILDSNSVIDERSLNKKREIVSLIKTALKSPSDYPLFEDYTTYVIEGIDEGGELIRSPQEALKRLPVSELLFAEPNLKLSQSMKDGILSSTLQYTESDLLVLDWNSSIVFDFTDNETYQDNIDMIEFSLSLSLKLRIYRDVLDDSTDSLYKTVDSNAANEITTFYSEMRERAGKLYLEFMYLFDSLDNSITTVGDAYLAKVLKLADRKFGLDDMKQSMSKKIETFSKISGMYQDKIDSLIDEKREKVGVSHTRLAHLLELTIVLLIFIPMIPEIPNAIKYVQKYWNIFLGMF